MEAVKAAIGWLWSKWKIVGHFITHTLNTILLILAYIVAIGPVSIALRITGQDILDKNWKTDDKPDSWWLPREPISNDLERYERQF